VHIACASRLGRVLLAAPNLLICSEQYFGNLLICPAGTPVRVAALLFVHYLPWKTHGNAGSADRHLHLQQCTSEADGGGASALLCMQCKLR